MSNTAWTQLQEAAGGAENIQGIVFGAWGWGSLPMWKDEHGNPEYEFGEPPAPIPEDKRGVLLSWVEAEPFLKNWSCYGGYGSPDCYAITMWTKDYVYFITQYDGSTRISEVPRNPIDHVPHMPGG